jgi:hypothetical protein
MFPKIKKMRPSDRASSNYAEDHTGLQDQSTRFPGRVRIESAREEPMTITPEQRQAIEQAGESPVELTDPQPNTTYYLVRADIYQRMQEIMEEEEDRREQDALLARSRKNRLAWVKENPY